MYCQLEPVSFLPQQELNLNRSISVEVAVKILNFINFIKFKMAAKMASTESSKYHNIVPPFMFHSHTKLEPSTSSHFSVNVKIFRRFQQKGRLGVTKMAAVMAVFKNLVFTIS